SFSKEDSASLDTDVFVVWDAGAATGATSACRCLLHQKPPAIRTTTTAMAIGVGNRRAVGRLAFPFLFDFFTSLKNWAARFPAAHRHYQSLDGGRLLSRDALRPLELVHDLAQVIAGRILHGREILVGLQFVEPQRLPEREKIPVVDVRRRRRGKGTA